MTALKIPETIAAYFRPGGSNGETIAENFAADAVVKDDGTTHVGTAAIREWMRHVAAEYASTVEPLALETLGSEYRVTGRVTGDFPGSPATLSYTFRLEGSRIASLEIAP